METGNESLEKPARKEWRKRMNIYLLKDCGNHELINNEYLDNLRKLEGKNYKRQDGFFYNCIKYLREFLGI